MGCNKAMPQWFKRNVLATTHNLLHGATTLKLLLLPAVHPFAAMHFETTFWFNFGSCGTRAKNLELGS
jgi:hypothetical protein